MYNMINILMRYKVQSINDTAHDVIVIHKSGKGTIIMDTTGYYNIVT